MIKIEVRKRSRKRKAVVHMIANRNVLIIERRRGRRREELVSFVS